MSKIEFHRELKKELGNAFEIDVKLTEFIKNYVNDLNTLPSIDEAVYFIINNYKHILKPVPTHIVRIKGVKFATSYPKLEKNPNLKNILIGIGIIGLFIGYTINQFLTFYH